MSLTDCQNEPAYYVGDELHQIKQEKIQKAITKQHLAGLLLCKAEAIRYVTDFYVKGYRPFLEPEYLAFIPSGKDPVVGYTSGSDAYRIQQRSFIKDHRKLPDVRYWAAEIIKIMEDYNITSGKIGTDFLPFQLYHEITDHFPHIEFVDITDLWIELTAVKHPLEIGYLRQAVKITEVGIQAALNSIQVGIKEYEVAAWAEYQMRKSGSEMTPFLTNVASGNNCAIFERISTDKVLHEGEMVILDLGCVWKGYTGDLGRTTCVSQPTPAQKSIYRATHLALQEAIKAIKPGVSCATIDAVARQVICESGYAKYQHRFATGHQLGYGLHNAPMISRNVTTLLKPGMVIALEPRITLYDQPEIGGVHLEDVILVTESGHEKLSTIGYDQNLLA